ncbi:MAG: DUF1707 domain-containing protein [Propionibacteriaceae bacterium]|jgi:hypothetical protein|nr:DUF1707 domain-containing protein [Propionibacteriaceae bacterium]
MAGERPEVRIGDAERDRAVELLREHMVAGRLDATEFSVRTGQALTSRTQRELDRLFTDLPRDPNAIGGMTRWQAPPPDRPQVTGFNWIFIVSVAATLFGVVLTLGNFAGYVAGGKDIYNLIGTIIGIATLLAGFAAAAVTRPGRALPASRRRPAIGR